MSKIIKHTFRIPHLAVKDGELVQDKETAITYQFTLLFKGLGLFEEITGKPLLNALMGNAKIDQLDENDVDTITKFIDKQFIKDLASASYIKIVGDKFHNNRVTVDEFRKSQVYPILENDYEFIMKLLNMAMECVYDDQKGKTKSKEVTRSKK